MKQCRRCLLPQGHFGVKLDKNGICNLCKYYDQHGEKFTRIEGLQDQLKERFNLLKGKYEYDAVVGLSGGKDSTYVLYKLVHDYGLKVLAMTYDNALTIASACPRASSGISAAWKPPITTVIPFFRAISAI